MTTWEFSYSEYQGLLLKLDFFLETEGLLTRNTNIPFSTMSFTSEASFYETGL